jgi:hypothetical protein
LRGCVREKYKSYPGLSLDGSLEGLEPDRVEVFNRIRKNLV